MGYRTYVSNKHLQTTDAMGWKIPQAEQQLVKGEKTEFPDLVSIAIDELLGGSITARRAAKGDG